MDKLYRCLNLFHHNVNPIDEAFSIDISEQVLRLQERMEVGAEQYINDNDKRK